MRSTGPLPHASVRMQLGVHGRDPLHEHAAPVVADEVDGLADRGELVRDPRRVLLLRRAEPVRDRSAEARQ